MTIEIRPLSRDRLGELFASFGIVFGIAPSPERVERFGSVPELQVLLGACDGDAIVGSTGAFTFDMTVPGGVAVETSGTTVVAVLSTHRRRGILRQMMRHHLDDARRRGQVMAALFASEGSIYGRFGYGLASLRGDMEIRRERTAFVPSPAPVAGVRVRLVSEAEAAAAFPPLWERVRLTRPGMLARSDAWWRVRRLSDPDLIRAGRPPLQRALLEIDGRPAAYALYRFAAPMGSGGSDLTLDVAEAIGDSPESTRAMWRYLFDIDLVTSIRSTYLPVDHPLLFALAEPARLQLRLIDGLWVRLVDVAAALSRRGYAADGPPLVIEVEDAFCPWNTGRYQLAGGVAERTGAPADLALDVDALGAVYLGGFGLTQLAQAGRVVERTPGALRRGDALFRGELAPWCPENF